MRYVREPIGHHAIQYAQIHALAIDLKAGIIIRKICPEYTDASECAF
ncbi:MAG: hypothetical protein LHW43_00820 [Candidatus Cloacimonetes bacterium]|nr:hypothetical protein [Candidatus Cloacimonadota bacterium]